MSGITSDIATVLITGGIGAALGTMGTAIIQTISKRGVSRAIAADRVTNAAGNLADRLDKMNEVLGAENMAMRKAMFALTDMMEDVIPSIPDESVKERAHRAITKARLALR